MDIFNLLHIDAEAIKDFPLLAGRVADHQTERVINRNTLKLQRIEEKILISDNIKVSPKSIEEVIEKVIRKSHTKNSTQDEWSFHELRIVSYYLMKLRDKTEYYQFGLQLLDSHWTNLFFNGLIFYLINSWHSIGLQYREMTCNLLVKRLKAYQDHNRRYLLYKEHANFFEPSGPQRMAALVKQKGMSILDAPKLLGFKNTGIQASYYSDVIISFFKNHEFEDFDFMDKVFELHPIDRTRKLVMASLIECESQRNDGLRRAKLCHYINYTMGDITLASTWAPFLGATDEEAEYLKRAKRTANNWYTQQFIESFFEICVQDRARKLFWLRYVNDIDEIIIVGSQSVKSVLRRDKKIGGLFLPHFLETSSTTVQTAALVMFMKNKVLVEFSDTGALYVYDSKHPIIKKIKRKSHEIYTISDLKIPSIGKLVESDNYYNYYEEQGRLAHIGHWQSRMQGWLEKMVLSHSTSFSQNQDYFHSSSHDYMDTSSSSDLPEFLRNDFHNEPLGSHGQTQDFESTALADTYAKDAYPEESLVQTETEEHTSLQAKEGNKPSNDYNLNGEVAYKKYLYVRFFSKLLEDHLRVIASHDGFYLQDKTTYKYACLQEYKMEKKANDSIWLKKTLKDNWLRIIHHNNEGDTTIGYLQVQNGSGYILFKKDWESTCVKYIRF